MLTYQSVYSHRMKHPISVLSKAGWNYLGIASVLDITCKRRTCAVVGYLKMPVYQAKTRRPVTQGEEKIG